MDGHSHSDAPPVRELAFVQPGTERDRQAQSPSHLNSWPLGRHCSAAPVEWWWLGYG